MKFSDSYNKHIKILEKKLRKIKIGKRFLVLFILFSFIPMLLIGIFTYNKSQETIKGKVTQYCVQINTGVRTNYDLFFKNIDEFSIELMYNKELQNELEKLIDAEKSHSGEEYFLESDILKYLKANTILSKNEILNISLKTKNNTNIVYDINLNGLKKFPINQIISDDIFNNAMNSKGKLIWNTGYKEELGEDESNGNTFQVSRTFNLTNKGNGMAGVVSILYSSNFLETVYNDITGEGDIYLIDSDNKVLFSNNKKIIYKTLPYESEIVNIKNNLQKENKVYSKTLEDKNILLTYSKLETNGWGVVYVAPYSQLIKENRNFGILIIVVSIILFFVTSISTFIFSKSISDPLKKLMKLAEKVELGNFKARVGVYGNDEITDLSYSFNNMIEKIDELIEEVYETKIREKDFKLRALQAQINPHFLYNTLDGIRWIARKNKDYDVSRRIENLSNMFRIVLKDEKIVTTLDEEIRYTEHYLFFQKQSFKERLEIVWNIDEAVKQYKVVKLLLQPIVENCIIHGMDTSKEKLIINITAKDNQENIYIKIEDNGIGVDSDNINRILHDNIKNSKNSIGIKNVNVRIKEYYGDQYGLQFMSSIGDGTIVEINIPKRD